jgi:hypothetical protein
MPCQDQPFQWRACCGREAGGQEGKPAARTEKGKNLPLGQKGTALGGDVSERISDREVQNHITDISGAFKVPLGAFRFPRSPDRNGNVDA